MIADAITVSETATGARLQARLRGGRVNGLVTWDFEGAVVAAIDRPGDAVFAAALPLAVARREELAIDAPVAAPLLERADAIAAIYARWLGLRPATPVVAQAAGGGFAGSAAGALFFTLGVDSFYSLLKAPEQREREVERQMAPIESLLFVHGYDIGLDDVELYEDTRRNIERVAAARGARALLTRTDLRALSEGAVNWELYHGAALASVGLALGSQLSNIVIASSWARENLRPWGSHPGLDPLWSTERTTFLHEGLEARRWQKVRAISQSPLALDNLRVCWEAPGRYNCGRCDKCLLTMLMLERTRALGRCATLPDTIDPALLRGLDLSSRASLTVLDDLLDGLGEPPGELARALASARRRAPLRRLERRVRSAGRKALRRAR